MTKAPWSVDDWLLEEGQPAVRYRALLDLHGVGAGDPRAERAPRRDSDEGMGAQHPVEAKARGVLGVAQVALQAEVHGNKLDVARSLRPWADQGGPSRQEDRGPLLRGVAWGRGEGHLRGGGLHSRERRPDDDSLRLRGRPPGLETLRTPPGGPEGGRWLALLGPQEGDARLLGGSRCLRRSPGNQEDQADQGLHRAAARSSTWNAGSSTKEGQSTGPDLE